MSADSKLDRAAAHAKQAARHTEDRAKKLQAPNAAPQNSGKRGGGGARPALNLGDEEDDGYDQSLGDSVMSTGTDASASQAGSPETRTTHVPLGEMVEAAKVEAARTRTQRSDTMESFYVVQPTRGVVALDGSIEMGRPSADDWERVDSHEAIDRPSYSDAARAAAGKPPATSGDAVARPAKT